MEATARGGYAPIAFRGTLQIVMVLALADMLTLLLLGSLSMEDHRGSGGVAFFAAALAMAVGFAGLYRLEIWGVLVTLATAIALGLGLLSRAVRCDDDFMPALLVLCALQLAVPAPMLASVAMKRPLPKLPKHVASIVGAALIGLVMLVATVAALAR